MNLEIKKIVSGGQTGTDRAALDFALENGIETGGYIPKNRRAEDGRISENYPNLLETETEDYAERTRLNVINSDATLILSHVKLAGGSLLTRKLAEDYEKPFLHVDFSVLGMEKAAEKARNWLASINCKTLNVAGPRASEDAAIYEKTKQLLTELIS